MHRRTVLALVVTIALALAACGGDGDDGAATTTTDRATTTEAPASSDTTAATEPTTTAPSEPTATTGAARDAANELKAAWEGGDQARARAIAPGPAVDALFAVPPGGFEVYGCDTAQFEYSSCNFRNRSTGVYVSVTMREVSEGAWQVDSLSVTQD